MSVSFAVGLSLQVLYIPRAVFNSSDIYETSETDYTDIEKDAFEPRTFPCGAMGAHRADDDR